jgi:glycosyltransferase involved in cell wall biosynthesis
MRIAIWHNLPSGGGKRALYDHVRGLAARGHHLEAWCPPTADRTFLPLSGLIQEHVVGLDWPAKFGRFDVNRSLAAMDAHCSACAEEIDRGEFDILFANSCQFFRATSIGRYVSLPSVLYQGEPFRWLYEALPRLRWLAPPVRKTGELFSPEGWKKLIIDKIRIRNWRIQAREEVDNAARFTRILVNSRFSRESILRAYGLDSTVCYLGIDTDQFVDLGREREDFVVGLGSFTPEKNLALIIEAIGLIAPPRPKLVWLGNISVQTYLNDMLALAKSRDVDFQPLLGVSDEALVDTLNRAGMMAYAPRLEPFGLAPLEAGACGVPVIAVAEGGVRESIEDEITGLHVESDAGAIAEAMARLRADPASAHQMGRRARLAVEQKWNLDRSTDRIENCLKRYAKSASAPIKEALSEAGRFADV